MFIETDIKKLNENFISDISDEWMLISAGDKDSYNMMTASWGFAGELWGNESVAVFIRPQRYTMDFVDKNDWFSLSFYGDNKAIHKICGSMSGRDVDKTALTGLTPVFDKAPYFEEARLVLICKKQYADTLKKDCFTDTEPLSCYKEGDYHRVVIGKIEKVLIKK